MQIKQIRFDHDSITYTWDDVPVEKYHNWVQNTKEVLNTRDYTAWGFPFMLQVEPTSLCNLSCPLCPTGRRELNRPYRHMRLNEFKSLIDDMERYLLFLVLWDWGEPLMNPELPSMIRYASERGIQTVTSTNAHFFNDETYTEELLKSGLTTLIVAVDSLGADRYEVYRKNGNLDCVLHGLKKAVSVKKRIGSKTLINVRMVIMKQNEHEIKEIEHMARVSGADVFTVKSLNPSCGMVTDEELVPANLLYRRYEYIPNTYERVRTDAICRRVWTMSNIFSNGDVVPCCYDYDSEMKVGNIFETPFTQIWNNSKYQQLRKKIYHEMQSIVKCNHCGINFKLSENGWFVKTHDLRSDHSRISFSIIMPTYNRKHCIKKAIDSLLAQTYQKFELIIIDDGSTDGTEEYLMEIYKEEIKKEIIKFIKLSEKRGASFARNKALSIARYNWIGYLDTDNQMHEDFLETFADSIEKNSSHEIYYAQIRKSQSQSIIGHEFNFDELVQFNFIDLGVFVHSAKIYSELGGFDIKLYRLIDWDLIIKYTEKYPPLFIEKVLLDYDDNTESARISNNVSHDEAYKQVILNYYKRISPQIFIERYTGHITYVKQAMAERDAIINSLHRQITEIKTSNSWKITLPLREVRRWLTNPMSQAKRYWSEATKLAKPDYMHLGESGKSRPPGNEVAAKPPVSGIYPLHIPLPPDEEKGFKSSPLFSTEAMMVSLACHVSVLTKGSSPHPPHLHDEEEILVLLAGEVDLILPDQQSATGEHRVRLKANQCVYYPVGFSHTLRTVSETPANYLMLKWKAPCMRSGLAIPFGVHNIIDSSGMLLVGEGFRPLLLFQGPTKYLQKLRCHASTLAPGAGYDPHSDPYCVAVIVLEGEVETLGERIRPHGVIFYGAGESHGMYNPGEVTARYVVFEFHG